MSEVGTPWFACRCLPGTALNAGGLANPARSSTARSDALHAPWLRPPCRACVRAGCGARIEKKSHYTFPILDGSSLFALSRFSAAAARNVLTDSSSNDLAARSAWQSKARARNRYVFVMAPAWRLTWTRAAARRACLREPTPAATRQTRPGAAFILSALGLRAAAAPVRGDGRRCAEWQHGTVAFSSCCAWMGVQSGPPACVCEKPHRAPCRLPCVASCPAWPPSRAGDLYPTPR